MHANPFENFPNPFKKGDEDSAKRSIESMFGKKGGLAAYQKDAAKNRPEPAAGGGGFKGFGGLGGGNEGGGGGGWNWGGEGEDKGEQGPEKPILQELKELFQGMWVVFWNAAAFLICANILHKSLDWCCQVELLLLVGAPTQAFERVASKFYGMIEWIEKNCFGWNIPGDEEQMPVYQQLALYYPEEHAYTFDSYRYPMTEPEKQAYKRYYALRWWERDGGFAGDVTKEEVQAIKDKYNPMEADRRAYREARAAGRLEEYWAARAKKLKEFTGSAEPPTAAAAT